MGADASGGSGMRARGTGLVLAMVLALVAAGCGGEPGAELEAGDDGAPTVDLGELTAPGTDLHGDSFRGAPFDPEASASPTAEKPQSKLWHHAGTWWAAVVNQVGDVSVHRLSSDGSTFADTGTLVDERDYVRADVLPVGDRIYVVTGGKRTYRGHAMQLARLSFRAANGRYTMDPGFPVRITEEGGGNGVLARDSTGRLWLSLVREGVVTISHSDGGDSTWVTPFTLEIDGSSLAAVEATLVAFRDRVGLLWADEQSGAFYFSAHIDGEPPREWRPAATIFEGLPADDHLNLKADSKGALYAVVKTEPSGVTTSRLAPQVVLLTRPADGQAWEKVAVARVKDRYTRPLLLIDDEQRMLYVVAASPPQGGIYYKRSSLDRLSFPSGPGVPLVQTEEDPELNNPTSTKQAITSSSGLVVLASDNSTGRYVHGVLGIGGTEEPAG